MAQRKDLLHGTLDSLILKTLAWGPRHGYGVARWLEQEAGDTLRVEEGSLYPALYRLEAQGWIEASWGKTETGRRAKFYSLSRLGRKQLALETERWRQFASAVTRILSAETP
jgi:transcriptional regulator